MHLLFLSSLSSAVILRLCTFHYQRKLIPRSWEHHTLNHLPINPIGTIILNHFNFINSAWCIQRAVTSINISRACQKDELNLPQKTKTNYQQHPVFCLLWMMIDSYPGLLYHHACFTMNKSLSMVCLGCGIITRVLREWVPIHGTVELCHPSHLHSDDTCICHTVCIAPFYGYN